MIVKILGFIDLMGALAFLTIIFGFEPLTSLMLFSSGLLFVKGLFIFTGDILSAIDLFAAFVLMISVFFTLPMIFLWVPAFFLLAKGMISFV